MNSSALLIEALSYMPLWLRIILSVLSFMGLILLIILIIDLLRDNYRTKRREKNDFKEFSDGNISGRMIVDSYWLEYLLNLFLIFLAGLIIIFMVTFAIIGISQMYNNQEKVDCNNSKLIQLGNIAKSVQELQDKYYLCDNQECKDKCKDKRWLNRGEKCQKI